MKLIKPTSLLLVLAFSLSVFGGCNSIDKSVELCKFYDYERYDMPVPRDITGYQTYMMHNPAIGNDGFVVKVESSINPALWSQYDSESPEYFYTINPEWLDYYSMEGELISSINMYDLLGGEPFTHVIWTYYEEDEFHVLESSWDKGQTTYKNIVLDPKTWETIDEEIITIPSVIKGDASIYRVEYYEGYVVYEYQTYEEGVSNAYLGIYKDGELLGILDASEYSEEESLSIPFYYYKDSKFLVFFDYGGQQAKFGLLDVNTMKVEEIDPEICDGLFPSRYDFEYFPGVGLLSVEYDGLKKLDIENGTKSMYFDFNGTFASRSDFFNSFFAYKDEKIICLGMKAREAYNIGTSIYDGMYLDVFTESENDPRIDKTRLTVGYFDIFNVYDAISRFNLSNPNYYLEIDSRYDKWNQTLASVDVMYDLNTISTDAYYVDLLARDILSGDGPDIVIGGFDYRRLNNSDVFIDLSGLTDDLSEDVYFKNIFDASKIDGKLYHLPLNFDLNCLVVDKETIEESTNGFTFDQYNKYLEENASRKDPIDLDRDSYFQLLNSTMMDLYIKDGRFDDSNGDFRKIASYIKDNIPQNGRGIKIDGFSSVYTNIANPIYGSYLSCFSLVQDYGSYLPTRKIVGLPSSDGRGVTANIGGSIGITKNATDINGCEEFIKELLGEEFQCEQTYKSRIPVNKSALTKYMSGCVDEYNSVLDYQLAYTSEMEYKMEGYDTKHVSVDDLSCFVAAISNCSNVYRSDPSVMLILMEEMPAYFENQKSLDDVVSVINNRANTYLSENG